MTTQTMRRHARKNGHIMGKFVSRYMRPMFNPPTFLYKICHCEKCGASLFSNDAQSAALTRKCGE